MADEIGLQRYAAGISEERRKRRAELDRLLEWARNNPPGPEELREQAVSWVRGELRWEHPDMTHEEADRRARDAWRRKHLKASHEGGDHE